MVLCIYLPPAGSPRAAVASETAFGLGRASPLSQKYFLRRSRTRCEGQGTVRGSRLGVYRRLDPLLPNGGQPSGCLFVYPDMLSCSYPAGRLRSAGCILQQQDVVTASGFCWV